MKKEIGMQLEEWASIHRPTENLMYKDGYWDQINFVNNRIEAIFGKNYEERKEIANNIRVISEHTSKSVLLPVYHVKLVDGINLTMRCNFHNWIVSVKSPRVIKADFMNLCNPNKQIKSVYCEGFPEKLVYGPYSQNKKQFTVELTDSKYHLFTFLWILAHRKQAKKQKKEQV